MIFSILGARSRFAFWEKDLTYEGESIYNYLQVREDDEEVILSTNVMFGVQSVMRKDGSLSGMYYDYAMAAPFMTQSGPVAEGNQDDGMKFPILGNGTGTYARQCLKYFPHADMTAVEIDEDITKLARQYFDMPDDVRVTTYDGRAFLQADSNRYDVIMVDAYQDISIPFQMASVEFFTMVRDHLKDGGVMVVNMNMRAAGKDNINDYLSDTIASVFPHVSTVDVRGYTNRELFAAMHDPGGADFAGHTESIGDARLRAMMNTVRRGLRQYPDTGEKAADGRAKEADRSGNRILTDDKAPVEMLSMRAIDEIIADELAYYKELYREEGLQGVLNSI